MTLYVKSGANYVAEKLLSGLSLTATESSPFTTNYPTTPIAVSPVNGKITSYNFQFSSPFVINSGCILSI